MNFAYVIFWQIIWNSLSPILKLIPAFALQEIEDDSSDRKTDAAIREVVTFKEKGTELFKAGKYAEAITIYLQGADAMPEVKGYREIVSQTPNAFHFGSVCNLGPLKVLLLPM